jgi:hypothetical protein
MAPGDEDHVAEVAEGLLDRGSPTAEDSVASATRCGCRMRP